MHYAFRLLWLFCKVDLVCTETDSDILILYDFKKIYNCIRGLNFTEIYSTTSINSK